MKEIKIENLNDKLYYEKLDNGLEIYLIPNNEVNNIYATITTKYGSTNTDFVPIDESKMISTPLGIAHFLEHKLFEQKDGMDPFTFFGKSGTDCNAHTSLKNTTYEFSGVENFKENLKYLLSFVGELYLTEDLVEKEKGIIEQELKMFLDDPFWILYDGNRNNTFFTNPTKFPIGGTVDSIKKIDKNILEKCYNTFYNPSNMFIVITGNFDKNEARNIIKDFYSTRNEHKEEIKNKKYKEKDEVYKKYEVVNKNIDNNKFGYSIKINLDNIKIPTLRKKSLYIGILFDILFGITSEFYENMTNKGYLSYPMTLDKFITDSHIIISFIGESINPNDLFTEIENTLKNININGTDLEELKKVMISHTIKAYDNITKTNDNVVNNVVTYGEFIPNNIEVIKSLNVEELTKIVKNLDLTNQSIFLIKPY